MDRLIAAMPAECDGDLMLADGVAYQCDMAAGRVAYDAGYLAKCEAYAADPVALAVNAGRCALMARQLAADSSVLDIGAGSGAFMRAAAAWGYSMRGFYVIPEGADRLKAAGLFADDASRFDAVTCWDCLEHMEDPGACVSAVRPGGLLFASIPVHENLREVRKSKHYRPGEHLIHWTAPGFIWWMAGYGFQLLEQSDHEVRAGRHSIGAFAFERAGRG